MNLAKGPQLFYIPVSIVDTAKYNPKNRDNPENFDVRKLAESIKTVGQLTPVCVTKKGKRYQLADGHRRLSAVKLLKQERILAHINGPETAKVYQHVNHYSKTHSPNQRLQSFLLNQQTAPTYLRTAFKNMIKEIGLPMVRQMAEGGYSLGTYKRAHVISKFTGLSTEKTLSYMMKTKQTGVLRSAMELGWTPKELKKVILSGKPLAV